MAQSSRKGHVYATGANGLTARVPADKMTAWQKAQEEIKSGRRKADPQIVEQLLSLMRPGQDRAHS